MFTSSESILRNNPSKTSSVEPKEKHLSPLPALAEEEIVGFPQLPAKLGIFQQSRFSPTSRASSRTSKYPDSPHHRNTFPLTPFRRNTGSIAMPLQQQNLAPILPLSVYRTFADFDSNYSFSIHPQQIGVGGTEGDSHYIQRISRMDEIGGQSGQKVQELSPHTPFLVKV